MDAPSGDAEAQAVQEETCPVTPPLAPLIEMDEDEAAAAEDKDKAAPMAAPADPAKSAADDAVGNTVTTGVKPIFNGIDAAGGSARDSPTDPAEAANGAQSAAQRGGPCDNCGVVKADLRKCPCLLVSYCDDTCQKAHWPKHRELCTKVRSNNANTSSNNASAPGTPSRLGNGFGSAASTPLKQNQPTPLRNLGGGGSGFNSPMMTSPMAGGGYQGGVPDNMPPAAALQATLNPKHLLDGFERIATCAPKTASRILFEIIKTNPTILYPAAVTMVKAGLSQVEQEMPLQGGGGRFGGHGPHNHGHGRPGNDPVSPFAGRLGGGGGNGFRPKTSPMHPGGAGLGSMLGGGGGGGGSNGHRTAANLFGSGAGAGGGGSGGIGGGAFGSLGGGGAHEEMLNLGAAAAAAGANTEALCTSHQTLRSRKHLQYSPVVDGWTCKPGLHCLDGPNGATAAAGGATAAVSSTAAGERRAGSPLLHTTSSPQPLLTTPDKRSDAGFNTPINTAPIQFDFDPNDSYASSIASAILADD